MPQLAPTPPKNRFQRRAIPDPHAKLGSPNSFNGPKTNDKKVDGSTTLGLADCDEFITPICLQTLYNIKGATPRQTRRNTFGVVEFTPQAFLQGDLGKCCAYYWIARILTSVNFRYVFPQLFSKPSRSTAHPCLY